MERRKLRIALLSNVTFEPYLRLCLHTAFAESAEEPEVLPISYEAYLTGEGADELRNADLTAVCLNFECLYPNAAVDLLAGTMEKDIILSDAKRRCQTLYEKLLHDTKAPVVWFGFEDYEDPQRHVIGAAALNDGLVDQTNAAIAEMINGRGSYIDLKYLIAEVGIKNAYDAKGKYRWNTPYSKLLMEEVSRALYKRYLICAGITKKCIVLDCDNVLWGGILTECGMEGVQLGSHGLGRAYQEFQRFLLMLYYRGVILTVCSKNDEEEVHRMFREHSGMVLREEYISAFQVNWDNKPENIQKIADSLNIGLDSMVFVDDSVFEVQAAAAMLPEVMGICYDRKTIYQNLSCFHLDSFANVETVQQRNSTYRTNEQRKRLKAQCGSFEEYLDLLQMNIEIHAATHIELLRIAELTQRTNQCTNGKRYTSEQLKQQWGKDGYRLYSVSVSDRFSDLGIVGAIGIEENILDLFSLSCRALGRGVEGKMLDVVRGHHITKAYFAETGKNHALQISLQELENKGSAL